jgi:hypothetical protein
MTYLCVIFIPPLYFARRKQWGACTLNSVLYGTAWLFLVTIIGAAFSPIFWALAVGHAGWHLRREMMEQHAELIARKMAEQFRQPVAIPGPVPLGPAAVCGNCGASVSRGAEFCTACGQSFKARLGAPGQ